MTLKRIVLETLEITQGNVAATYERLKQLGVSHEYVRQVAKAPSPIIVPKPSTPSTERGAVPADTEEPQPLESIEDLRTIREDPLGAFLNAIIPQNKLGLMKLRDTAIENLQERLDRDGVSNGHLLSLLRLTLEHEAALRALARPAAQLVVNDQRTAVTNFAVLVDKLEDLDTESLMVLAKQQPRVLKSISPRVIDAKDYEPKV